MRSIWEHTKANGRRMLRVHQSITIFEYSVWLEDWFVVRRDIGIWTIDREASIWIET